MSHLSAWPGLNPLDLVRRRDREESPFPFSARNVHYGYAARGLIFRLFRALRDRGVHTVCVPDFHHGTEVRAIRAAGVTVEFYPIRRDLQPDLSALARLSRKRARAILVIHYLGWPQPIQEIARMCRAQELVLVEDCALALLSRADNRPLGSFGDFAVFSLYKTLPVPNGAALVENGEPLPELRAPTLTRCPRTAVAGRCLELCLEWTQNRIDWPARDLLAMKRLGGRVLRAAGAPSQPIGDDGFDPGRARLGMSPLSARLLRGFDYDEIVARRRNNYRVLRRALSAGRPGPDLPLAKGVCPLFFPLIVADKAAAARELWERGVGAIQFWNQGAPGAEAESGPDSLFLRRHVLELPIHQDLHPHQLVRLGEQLLSLKGYVETRRSLAYSGAR